MMMSNFFLCIFNIIIILFFFKVTFPFKMFVATGSWYFDPEEGKNMIYLSAASNLS